MDKLLPWYYKQSKPFGAYDIFDPNESNTYVCSASSKYHAELIINSVNQSPQQRCAVKWPEKKEVKGYDHDCGALVSCGGCKQEGRNAAIDADTEYFVSVLEGLLIDLKHVSHHSVSEELWRIEGALKSVKGER